jgi:hypothetical protein
MAENAGAFDILESVESELAGYFLVGSVGETEPEGRHEAGATVENGASFYKRV